MDEFKKKIRQELLNKRKNLSEKSLISYISTLSNLPKKLNDNNVDSVKYFVDNDKKIINFLKNKPPRSRKSVLSPLVVITDQENYKKLMKSDIESYQNAIIKQEKTENEKDNWMKWDDILKVHRKLKDTFELGLKQKEMNENIYNNMNAYVLLSFFVLFPPRRALDYAILKYRNYDKEKDNFIDLKKQTITFNEFKTQSNYGSQTFKLPKELIQIVKKYIKFVNKFTLNETDYLIDTNNHESLDITKILNNTFKPKKISVNIIRHSFLTDFYSNGMPTLEVMTNLAQQMGHSVSSALLYIRKTI